MPHLLQGTMRIPVKMSWAGFILLFGTLFPVAVYPEIPGAVIGAKSVTKPIWDGSGTYVWEINHDVGTPWSLFNVSDTLTYKVTLAVDANIWIKTSGDRDGKYIDLERVIRNKFKDFEIEELKMK